MSIAEQEVQARTEGGHNSSQNPGVSARRSHSVLKAVTLAAVWFVLAELAVRTFVSSVSQTLNDPSIGWRYVPNSTTLLATNDAGHVRLSVNELGLNDAPLSPKAGRLRVLALGDSFVEAAQVRQTENFTSVLEQQRPDLDVVNGGRAGLDPRGTLAVFQRLESIVKPDQVVLVITDNDFLDLRGSRYKHEVCEDGRVCGMELIPSTKDKLKDLMRVITTRSALLNYLLGHYEDAAKAALGRIRGKFAGVFRTTESEKPTATEQEDVQDLEEFVLAIQEIARELPMLIVFIPDLSFQPGGEAEIADLSVHHSELLQQQMHEVRGVTFINVGAGLAEAYRQDGQPPLGFNFGTPGEGHLNVRGHRALATVLGAYISNAKPSGEPR